MVVLVYILFIRDAREERLMREGEALAEKVDAFMKETGRLPGVLSETGIEETETGPLYYQKQDSTHYIIWFGTSLGESTVYHSGSKTWHDR